MKEKLIQKIFGLQNFALNSALIVVMFYWYLYRLIGLVGRVFTNGPGSLGSIPGRVTPKTLKTVLGTSLLNTQVRIRYVSRVKWSNPGKGVAPSHTLWCSSYWKRSLLIALDCSRQLYLITFYWFINCDLINYSPRCHSWA